MKTATTMGVLLLALSAAAPARAQEKTKMAAGIDLVGEVPLGDLTKKGLAGFGALVRYEYALSPSLTLTGRTGYIFHAEKNDITKFWLIPVLAGAKLNLLGPVFLAGELGFFFTQVKATTGGIYYGPDNAGHLGLTLGAGYRWRQFDARLGLHMIDIAAPADWTAFALSLGYSFWFL